MQNKRQHNPIIKIKKLTARQKHTFVEYSGQYHSDLKVNPAFTFQ